MIFLSVRLSPPAVQLSPDPLPGADVAKDIGDG